MQNCCAEFHLAERMKKYNRPAGNIIRLVLKKQFFINISEKNCKANACSFSNVQL